jgi:hypothetical protein
VADYLEFERLAPRRFFLLDTFRGLDDRYITEGERAAGFHAGGMGYSECHDHVVRTFRDYPNVVIVRGSVPETLAQVDAERVAYLHIDMNGVVPEIAAADHFWPRLVPGGVMVLDDYGWVEASHQHDAFDAWAQERGVGILALPTGQGMIFKP